MSDQKFSCQGCDRTDLTLTRNGKVRSHAPNGKRASEDNPACGMGSEYPKESTEFHTHRFEYGDDNHGHSGSFCDCGMEEPDDPIADQGLSQDPAQHVPPNPFRDPLPGGMFDSLPHDRQLGDAGVSQRGEIPHNRENGYDVLAAERPAEPRVVLADSFLDGADDDLEEAADNGPSYWPARYDGECGTCYSHFNAGENIRRLADGSYEAQECCGSGAAPQPDRPRSVARTLPVVNGRYRLPHPVTGKTITGQRSSKFAEGIADSYALDQWRHRMILAGLLNDPEIMDKVASALRDLEPLEAVKTRRNFLNARADEAITAAGGDIRSGKGTTLHKYTEEVDGGTRALADVPEEYRRDAAAYVLALAECGFRPVKGLIERSVYCDGMNVCGTFDRVLECIRTTNALDLDGRETTIRQGEFVIGDVKSGDNIKHPWLEILIQEALYAHGVNENGVAVQDEPGGPFRWVRLEEFGAKKVREDVGVVMHIPYGSGECKFYAADLITGWRGAKICKDNRDFWKIKLPKVPIATYAVGETEKERQREADEVAPVILGIADDDQFTCFCGEHWNNVETANAYDHDYKSCGPDEPATDGEDHAPGPDDQEFESPRNIMDAVKQAKDAAREAVRLGFIPPTAATVKMPESPVTDPWEGRFRSVRTREAANKVWADAKAAGLPSEGIKRLVALVKLEDPKPQTAVSSPGSSTGDEPVAEEGGSRPPAAQEQEQPNLTERAHRVTTKAEAHKVFQEANEKINGMPEEKRPAAREYRDKLVGIMKERLATKV